MFGNHKTATGGARSVPVAAESLDRVSGPSGGMSSGDSEHLLLQAQAEAGPRPTINPLAVTAPATGQRRRGFAGTSHPE
jgi:hypothetical protein